MFKHLEENFVPATHLHRLTPLYFHMIQSRIVFLALSDDVEEEKPWSANLEGQTGLEGL